MLAKLPAKQPATAIDKTKNICFISDFTSPLKMN
jgi:hypothetical protein